MKPVVEDSKVSTETHCLGFVVSLSLLLPILSLQGFHVALLYANSGQICPIFGKRGEFL